MAKTQSWEVSDELWQNVEPLVPKPGARRARKHYERRPGGGRKPLGDRQIFAGIVYVLRTGCQWKALPKSFGSASSVHKHFQRWRGQGFFLALWQAGLAEYDEMEGIAWEWQSIDGTQGKAPLAQEAVGKTAAEARQVFDAAKAYQDAGAIGVEIEIVPAKVAEEINRRLEKLILELIRK